MRVFITTKASSVVSPSFPPFYTTAGRKSKIFLLLAPSADKHVHLLKEKFKFFSRLSSLLEDDKRNSRILLSGGT